ncbi:phosphoenolpyruvate synthase [Streptomyces sp. rh34]|uniref:phosphoenolpyruvate synthase n=1 Tax=Streptomyces sp. rh34 TaxID=2034272 RepID=UPI00211D4BD9|nr:phosphoenolpyruvate synthase [Streptomyces sp. rh34]
MTDPYVLDLEEVDETRVAAVGGKGAHLGGLSRIEGVRVPDGFCVTTDAFRRAMTEVPSIDDRLDELARLNPDDREAIRTLSAHMRRTIEDLAVPGDLAEAITGALARFGEHAAYAVRSSATAEDLPTASFAGQQDTYLNVLGPTAVLQHISRCWASMFTERAVVYRQRNGIDHRTVHMAVVVQRMVFPQASGILFTADPVTGHRKVATVDAGFGLGEALVSGLVNPDVFTVRDGEVVTKAIAAKERAVHALPTGGTREVAVDARQRVRPALTDEQAVRLVGLGRRIEAHFGRPQDIEWCLVDDGFRIVQSRPITTLFPLPVIENGEEGKDEGNHVYVSVGHQQMMTDPMKPLGFSMWQLTAMVPMHEAGGRLFVDVTRRLASPTGRDALLDAMGKGDPLVRDALETVLERDGFVPSLPDAAPGGPPFTGAPDPIETDPAVVTELIERSRTSIAALERDIRTKEGPALFDFLLEAFEEHKRVLADPLSMQAIMAGMDATWWLNDKLREWLGEKNAADTLTLSAPDNITSEMGLALLDVADVIRPLPEVLARHDGRGGRPEQIVDLNASVAQRLRGPTVTRPSAPQSFVALLVRRVGGSHDILRIVRGGGVRGDGVEVPAVDGPVSGGGVRVDDLLQHRGLFLAFHPGRVGVVLRRAGAEVGRAELQGLGRENGTDGGPLLHALPCAVNGPVLRRGQVVRRVPGVGVGHCQCDAVGAPVSPAGTCRTGVVARLGGLHGGPVDGVLDGRESYVPPSARPVLQLPLDFFGVRLAELLKKHGTILLCLCFAAHPGSDLASQVAAFHPVVHTVAVAVGADVPRHHTEVSHRRGGSGTGAPAFVTRVLLT